jgi:hypothetical protein
MLQTMIYDEFKEERCLVSFGVCVCVYIIRPKKGRKKFPTRSKDEDSVRAVSR